MTTTETEEFLLPAPHELVQLASAMRPAWDAGLLSAAIAGAMNAGWSWARIFAAVTRLLQIKDSGPHDLTVEVSKTIWHAQGQAVHKPPAEYLAAKAALNRRTEDHDAQR